jgi:hypothetical protein
MEGGDIEQMGVGATNIGRLRGRALARLVLALVARPHGLILLIDLGPVSTR